MSEEFPVKERIMQAIATQLATITIAGGYHVDVEAVVRPRRTGEEYVPEASGISLLQGEETENPEDDAAGDPPLQGWMLPVLAECVIRQSVQDERPMDQVLNVFEADVRKALMVDPTWGGLAIRSQLRANTYPDPSNGVEGVIVPVEVYFRTAENDPYQLG